MRDGRSRIVVVLGITQITSWGVLYYAFPVLAQSISSDTGWSMTMVTGAFSVGLVTSAVIGVPVGRLLDQHGPWALMTGGGVLAAAATAGIAAASRPIWFFAAWMVAGVAMAAVLYQPAFSAITRWFEGRHRIRALTALTLAGGLASTVFAPLTAALAERLEWRGAYLVLAVVLLLVTVPLHAAGLRRPWPSADQHSRPDRAPVGRSRPFVLLTVAFTLYAFALFAALINLVPLLTSRGASLTVAAWALGLGGVGQVLGRLGYGMLVRRFDVRARTVGVLLAGAITTAVLGLVPGPIVVLVALAMMAGAVRGIATLLQATAVTERWGTTQYATLSALLGAPVMMAIAVAPWVSTALVDVVGGYPALFVVLGLLPLAAAVLAGGTTTGRVTGSRRRRRPSLRALGRRPRAAGRRAG
ncbi:MAG TPA: MFS transporter [Jiangellaceae bacterium]|nr:MFS transporter [Jiangellaceae bacterium]